MMLEMLHLLWRLEIIAATLDGAERMTHRKRLPIFV